ncbi:ABC transporter permease [Acetobacter estunensis]|uniref:ABC transporter permease n=1 Tax=Acetobacter estunensis TaxID=104097 RepID=UPI001C2D30CD|nr:ABC transporter permease [Acetobacter estunensis]MBV1837923.1 ABC transporter permease [Acetobacter estunensis]
MQPETGPKQKGMLRNYFWFYVAFLYAPILVLPVFSFNDSLYVTFPLKGFTFSWYHAMFADPRIRESFFNSLFVAIIASCIATFSGTLTAYTLVRRNSRLARFISNIGFLPLVVPGVMLGIGLLVIVNLVGIGPSLPAVMLGHICVCFPLTLVIMRGRFQTYSRTIEEAARDLGASPWVVLWRVALPIVMPGIVSCLILSFTTSFDEFIVSYFLTGSRQTLPVFIWSNLRYAEQLPKILALGTLIFFASALLVGGSEIIQNRLAARRGQER